MSSALWCVTNGRAAAPPAIGCIIGVSTSTKPRASRNARIAVTTFARISNDAPRVGVDDQVEVALAVARLDVGQAVPLLGQRQEALGQERAGSRAQIVSSPVRVRNRCPSTPT